MNALIYHVCKIYGWKVLTQSRIRKNAIKSLLQKSMSLYNVQMLVYKCKTVIHVKLICITNVKISQPTKYIKNMETMGIYTGFNLPKP